MRAALQVCQSRGMDLATLPSQAVHDELHSKVVAVMTDNWWVCAFRPMSLLLGAAQATDTLGTRQNMLCGQLGAIASSGLVRSRNNAPLCQVLSGRHRCSRGGHLGMGRWLTLELLAVAVCQA
jgi:hypothetical protein